MIFDSHNLFEDFELSGFGWLTTHLDNQIPGILKYRAGARMTLESFGSFKVGWVLLTITLITPFGI